MGCSSNSRILLISYDYCYCSSYVYFCTGIFGRNSQIKLAWTHVLWTLINDVNCGNWVKGNVLCYVCLIACNIFLHIYVLSTLSAIAFPIKLQLKRMKRLTPYGRGHMIVYSTNAKFSSFFIFLFYKPILIRIGWNHAVLGYCYRGSTRNCRALGIQCNAVILYQERKSNLPLWSCLYIIISAQADDVYLNDLNGCCHNGYMSQNLKTVGISRLFKMTRPN